MSQLHRCQLSESKITRKNNGLQRFNSEVSIHPTISGKQLYTSFGILDYGEWLTYSKINQRDLQVGDCVEYWNLSQA